MGQRRGRKALTVRVAIRKVEADAWEMLPRKGTNHRQFKHQRKKGKVTISGNPGDELSPRTADSIRQQAGLTPEEWDAL